jgi:hypothetical protein
MISAELTGDRKVGLLFDEFPQRAHDAFLAKITELTSQLESRVLGAVPVRTGELRSQVQAFVDDKGTRITGKVKVLSGGSKSDHGKAAALEFGAHGHVAVSAHTRQIRTVFGRAVAPTAVFVAAYGRTANIAEHRFLRNPLATMSSEIIEELRAALASVEGAG